MGFPLQEDCLGYLKAASNLTPDRRLAPEANRRTPDVGTLLSSIGPFGIQLVPWWVGLKSVVDVNRRRKYVL